MSLKILFKLSISLAVLYNPTKHLLSLTIKADPICSDPLFPVAAPIYIYRSVLSSSYSWIDVEGWTQQPELFIYEYVATNGFPAIVVLKTSTPNTR